jgi:hypothetical protein
MVPAPLILDFDSENRALSYLGGDFTTKELTGIAWSFGDPEHIEVRTLGFGEKPIDVLRDLRGLSGRLGKQRDSAVV